MRTTFISRLKPAARVAPAVLVGLSLLAACDTDRPVAPEPKNASAVSSPSAYRTAFGAIEWKVVDESQAAVPGYADWIVTGPGNYYAIVFDGSQYYDSDPAASSVRLKGLTPGTYQVCQNIFPTYYLNANPKCQTANVIMGTTTSLTFVDVHQPRLLWKVVDEDDTLVPGATFVLTDSLNNKVTMTDNGIYDGNKTGGMWQMFAWPQTLKICETVAPPGYVLPAQPCITFVAKGGLPTDLGKFVNTLVASIKIEVLSDKFLMIGPSSFKIYGANTITMLDDNSPFDLYPKYGLLKVKLPAPGTYTVCQTSAPYGFDPATPACKPAVNVPYGVPVWGGLFINKAWPVPR